MNIVALLGAFASALNKGRAPAAKQEGQWLKLLYGRKSNWIRLRRIGAGLVEVQMPVRLTGICRQVSLTHQGGLATTRVQDVPGYKLPQPPEPQEPELSTPGGVETELPPPLPVPPRRHVSEKPENETPSTGSVESSVENLHDTAMSGPLPVEEPGVSETSAPPEPKTATDDLDDMTHAELDERAEMLGIKFIAVDGKLYKEHKIAQIRAFFVEE